MVQKSKLSNNEIDKKVRKLDGWKIRSGKLSLDMVTDGFTDSVEKLNKIALAADKMDHHPDVKIYSYNKMKITIFAHEVKGLTESDFKLASKISELNID